MISIEYDEIPVYLHGSKFYEGIDGSDHSAITIPKECFRQNASIHDWNDFDNLLHTIRFWMIGDPSLTILTFFLTNEVSSYLTVGSNENLLLLSLPFGKEYIQLKDLPGDERVEFAIRHSQSLEMVQRLHSLDNSLPPNMCALAAKRDRLDLLQYAHSRKCQWGNTARIAISRGHVDCLHFAFSNGCPVDGTMFQLAAEKGQLACLKYLCRIFRSPPSACVFAAKHGHLECLRYLHEQQQVPWDANTTDWAAKQGHLPCLIYAHQHGCPLSSQVTELACERGDLACLHYAVKHGSAVTGRTCAIAAYHGHLSCLQFAHRMGCEVNEHECRVAAQHGRLHCLQYLHERGCPWGEDILVDALWANNWSCAVYALRQGCPRDDHAALVKNYVTAWLLLLVQYCFPHWVNTCAVTGGVVLFLFCVAIDFLVMYRHKVEINYPAWAVKPPTEKEINWVEWVLCVLLAAVVVWRRHELLSWVFLLADYAAAYYFDYFCSVGEEEGGEGEDVLVVLGTVCEQVAEYCWWRVSQELNALNEALLEQ